MSSNRSDEYVLGLVSELCMLPNESEWVEFKQNDAEPQRIGEYISALANSAALVGKAHGYIVWGIRDDDHAVIGTALDPHAMKVGNEELENWLLRLLNPRINVQFFVVTVDEKRVVLLEVSRAMHQPVRFSGEEYIRVGSYTKKLKDFPEKERELWLTSSQTTFEDGIAADRLPGEEVLQQLDYPAYFDLLNTPLPENRSGILSAFEADNLICRNEAGGWDITNLGAILFAKKLEAFPQLKRKAMRVIQYSGVDHIETFKEQEGTMGYACGFEGMISYINGLLPANEVIHQALRQELPMFPELAVRELVANALIHQDFFETGTGPMVEIFDDRLEITNPGKPLLDTQHFLNSPPKSRNETLASLMRRFGICEERGSGIDKVVFEIEFFQLPAPLFEEPEGFTKATMFSHKPLSEMDKVDRIRACYLHACLKRVTHDYLTNASLRKRFGVEQQNKAAVSRYIRDAVNAGLIKAYDEHSAPKLRKYVPFWA